MAAPTKTETLNTLYAANHSLYDKEVYDTLFKGLDFFNEFVGNGSEVVYGGNGKDIRFNIGYQTSSTKKWLQTSTAVLDSANIDPVLQGVDSWTAIGDLITIPLDEMHDNMGAAQIFDLVEVKTQSYIHAIQRDINQAMMSASSTTTAGQCNSIIAEIKEDPTTGTLANINRANITTWRNQTDITGGAAAVNLLPLVRRMSLATSKGAKSKGAKLVLCSRNMYEAFWSLADPRQRFTGADAKFSGFPTFGDTKWLWDDDYPNDTSLRMLHNDKGPDCGIKVYVTQRTMEGGGPWQEPYQQFTATKKLKIRFQLIFPNMPRNGVLTNIVI